LFPFQKIKWHLIKELPSYNTKQTPGVRKTENFWMVSPVVGRLKKWVHLRRLRDKRLLTAAGTPKKLLLRNTPGAPLVAHETSLQPPNNNYGKANRSGRRRNPLLNFRFDINPIINAIQ